MNDEAPQLPSGMKQYKPVREPARPVVWGDEKRYRTIHLRTSFRRANGEILVTRKLHYPRPTGINPSVYQVTLERVADGKQITVAPEAIWNLVDERKLIFIENIDKGVFIHIELTDTELITSYEDADSDSYAGVKFKPQNIEKI